MVMLLGNLVDGACNMIINLLVGIVILSSIYANIIFLLCTMI